MSIKLDKNTVFDLENRKVAKILLYFYEAWCSGTKIDLKEHFELKDDLEKINLLDYGFDVYLEKKDKKRFENSIITKTINKDHSWEEKVRYIFSNEKIKDRCGCGSSFSFEAKKIKIDLAKLKDLRNNFKAWKKN